MADILVTNASRLLTAADIAPVIATINRQIASDFAPAWGTPGTLHVGAAPAGAWRFSLQDTSDDPNVLGYHVDKSGIVSAIIDVEACKSSGSDWRTCLGHEVLEALADPLTTRMAPDQVTIVEVCDPVEEDSYEIGGVPVTNFVLPAYFGFNASTKYDRNGWLAKPAPALRPGGYIMRLENGAWQTHFGERSVGYMASRINGRRAWRKKTMVVA